MAEAIPLRTAEAVVRDVVRRAAGCVGAEVLAVLLAEYDARGPVATTPPHCPTSSTAGAVR